ncbi:MAG: HAD hydrolase family protein, partial [Erysipelotrichaceae bacterium]|nr:HAD hydrolase family protein [Erysipelotrichaceae bacterium]
TSEALAIGDSPLDYPLLEKAGYKAAVNNAYYELRELANIHLPNNDEDGAALLLEYYTKQVQ